MARVSRRCETGTDLLNNSRALLDIMGRPDPIETDQRLASCLKRPASATAGVHPTNLWAGPIDRPSQGDVVSHHAAWLCDIQLEADGIW